MRRFHACWRCPSRQPVAARRADRWTVHARTVVVLSRWRFSQAEQASPAESERLRAAATIRKLVLSMLTAVIGRTEEHVYRFRSAFVRAAKVSLPAAVARKLLRRPYYFFSGWPPRAARELSGTVTTTPWDLGTAPYEPWTCGRTDPSVRNESPGREGGFKGIVSRKASAHRPQRLLTTINRQ